VGFQFKAAKVYDYHPPMRLPDPESPDRSLGDCAICMDAILVDPSMGEKGSPASKEASWAGTAESHPGGIFNVVHRNVVEANIRKSYSLAPCHHLFVSFFFAAGLIFECGVLTCCAPAHFLS
jgi:hypothetical protein